MSLSKAFQEVSGIGEAKASGLVEIVNEHSDTPDDPLLEKAITHAENNDNRKAGIFLRRYSRE